MTIKPLVGSPGPAAAGPASPDQPGHTGLDRADKPASAIERAAKPSHQDEADLQAVHQWAADRGIEIRFETLPDSKATVLRIIDSRTGHVLNEFPPEGVAVALAKLKAKAGEQTLDHRA